jgi:hypothetical protein
MRPFRAFARSRAGLALGLALCGCGGSGDDLPRETVSGKVTFEGEPLARGAILFRTSAPGAAGAMDAGGLIRDGEYRIPRSEGPVPGTYKIMITEEVERLPGSDDAPGPRPRVKPSRLSARYNARTTLIAEIKPGAPNTFDFDLKKSDERELASPRARGPRR